MAVPDYHAFAESFFNELEPLPPPCDAWAFWHYAHWAPSEGRPSLFYQLYREEGCADGKHRQYTQRRRRATEHLLWRILALGEMESAHGLDRGLLSSWRWSPRARFLCTAEGRKRLPDPWGQEAQTVQMAYVPAIPARHERILTNQIQRYAEAARAAGLQCSDAAKAHLLRVLCRIVCVTLGVDNWCRWKRPEYLVCEADNYGWGLGLSLVGRHRKIPTIALSHGLDCDPWVYDHAFANFQVAWGGWRLERFRQTSRYSFSGLAAGDFRGVERIVRAPKQKPVTKLLWITRPHAVLKCYTPEFAPEAGVERLRMLLSVTGPAGIELIIKPHPRDVIDTYEQTIEQSKARARIFHGALESAVDEADAVVGEQSTATAEAVYSGLPVAVLGTDPEIVPFSELGIPQISEPEHLEEFLRSPFVPAVAVREAWLKRLFGEPRPLDWKRVLDMAKEGVR